MPNNVQYLSLSESTSYGISRKLTTGLEPGMFDALARGVSREIDRYLRMAGARTPLEDPDHDIRMIAADMMRLKIMMANGVDPSTDLYQLAERSYEMALASLQAIVDNQQSFEDDDKVPDRPVMTLETY